MLPYVFSILVQRDGHGKICAVEERKRRTKGWTSVCDLKNYGDTSVGIVWRKKCRNAVPEIVTLYVVVTRVAVAFLPAMTLSPANVGVLERHPAAD
jgi:hypothetical protein